MPETAALPDFRLYHSNSLEVLAGLLAAELRTPAPGQSVLTPDTVLIPQVAMRRWLQSALAAQYGIAANLEFLTPGEFVGRALQANVPGEADDLDAAAMRWRVYAALSDPDVLAKPALAAVRAHLAGDDPVKPWALAGELGGIFEKYQAWRGDWLLRWESGASPSDPQAVLWRHVAAGQSYRARRIQTYLDRFAANSAACPIGLPARLSAFATLNVSPDVLRVMATQARVGTLHFYLPTPTKSYWGDLQTLAGKLRAEQQDPFSRSEPENPLLQAWGAAGRDFFAVLGSYEVVHPSGEIAAYADPEERADDRPERDSLLQRLQRDLLHRRPPPATAWRRQVDLGDRSLQVHACHTRLREVQVLHDQLRGLLEDSRFDPPLQPREIAVLAPDIDPYAPYLEAAFGGGQEHRLPYTVADTSPLAEEPLADLFVRLLALPVSRFGLDEILGLLSSPAIAHSAGLDRSALERLHGWLHGAGARWGLDAAHREQQLAPRDDAYTWGFALDRLLLGHASGSEGDIAGIAPWPHLEGSAVDALDALIRLLRVLARHQRTLGDALVPGQWRERLFGLLDALLPRPPQDPRTQRALDRLRRLVDDFARDAARAGFDAPVPAEVVRAHFSGALAEADTRAPLLTGGISFGRMVPMRLLPFRVICMLGLNDGDYPRRDPGAGLNQLTAELGTERRRHGDRSVREDDRFLFLQQFAAAQDVFYLSYLGADPRDGSAREPSVLVKQLIQTAACYHADADAATKALIVHHTLQPFAADAFGSADEPRRFSYLKPWWKAAAQPAQLRVALPAWFNDSPLAPVGDEGDALSLDTLRRFLQAPAQTFLRERLGMRMAEVEEIDPDVEPLLAPGRGLARHVLQKAVFEARLRGDDDATTQALLRARGLLPSGPRGRRALESVRREVDDYADAFRTWRGDALGDAPRLEVDLGGVRLSGRIADVFPRGIARIRFGKPGGNSSIRDGLDWLLAGAAGLEVPLVQFHDGGESGKGPHTRPTLDPGHARALLARLIALRAQGLRTPLPFAPYSGWELFNAPDTRRGLENAAKRWRGSDRRWAEGDSEALRLALRGRDPFNDEATQVAFVDQAMTIFSAVVSGALYAGTDLDTLRMLAADLDMEEAE
ncbi:MAG: exodeoxyribonuclease V subunit gamma [Pseudoxanthomonas sp.]|nr:exodeoxyribonuclease V subunit gamma [Pseudoxanthomonas sp.]